MKLIHGLAAIVLMGSAAMAQAEVTGTVTAVSDYRFRGVSLTSKDPALQGSIDWASEGGFYAGAWASNIDYGNAFDGNIELDLYGGFAGETEGGLGYDVGLVWYLYPDSDGSASKFEIKDYPELYAGVTYKFLEGKVWYSNDNSGSDEDSFYLEGNASFELPASFALNLHAGYYWGDYFDSPDSDFKDSDYMDYSIGVGYTLGNFDLELKWMDNTLDDGDYYYTETDEFNVEDAVVFSVATTFPWGGKE